MQQTELKSLEQQIVHDLRESGYDKLKFGQIVIVVVNGNVTQIEKKETFKSGR